MPKVARDGRVVVVVVVVVSSSKSGSGNSGGSNSRWQLERISRFLGRERERICFDRGTRSRSSIRKLGRRGKRERRKEASFDSRDLQFFLSFFFLRKKFREGSA